MIKLACFSAFAGIICNPAFFGYMLGGASGSPDVIYVRARGERLEIL
jgi:hypothetical protein